MDWSGSFKRWYFFRREDKTVMYAFVLCSNAFDQVDNMSERDKTEIEKWPDKYVLVHEPFGNKNSEIYGGVANGTKIPIMRWPKPIYRSHGEEKLFFWVLYSRGISHQWANRLAADRRLQRTCSNTSASLFDYRQLSLFVDRTLPGIVCSAQMKYLVCGFSRS